MKTIPKMIFDRLENGCFGSKTIPVYGCVWHYANRHERSDGSIATFEDIKGLAQTCDCVINNAKFFTPEVKPSKVLMKICALLLVDYGLLEVALNCRIDEFDVV